MNKAYRLIWSIAKDAWVIVAEDVKTKSGRPRATVTIAVTMAMLAGAVSAFGAPVGTGGNSGVLGWGDSPTVTVTHTTGAGVNFGISNYNAGTNNYLTVDGGFGGKSVLSWDKLNTASGQYLDFSGTNAIYLNKVTGVNPSVLAGTMYAHPTGTVLIVNPNGITVSNGATIGVSNLLMSTAPLTAFSDDANLLDSNLNAALYNVDRSTLVGDLTLGIPMNLANGLRLQGNTIVINPTAPAEVRAGTGLTIEAKT